MISRQNRAEKQCPSLQCQPICSMCMKASLSFATSRNIQPGLRVAVRSGCRLVFTWIEQSAPRRGHLRCRYERRRSAAVRRDVEGPGLGPDGLGVASQAGASSRRCVGQRGPRAAAVGAVGPTEPRRRGRTAGAQRRSAIRGTGPPPLVTRLSTSRSTASTQTQNELLRSGKEPARGY